MYTFQVKFFSLIGDQIFLNPEMMYVLEVRAVNDQNHVNTEILVSTMFYSKWVKLIPWQMYVV